MLCPKCNVELVPGQAIRPLYERTCLTICQQIPITAENLQLIKVLKCPKCGHSDDGTGDGKKLMGVENRNARI